MENTNQNPGFLPEEDEILLTSGEDADKTAAVEDDADSSDGGIQISKSKLQLIRKLLENIKENNEQLTRLLSGVVSEEEEIRISLAQSIDQSLKDLPEAKDGEKIIEGVFDGEDMVGPDGKRYHISANYASKSKLVEGDVLKLSITANGTFVYKQIGPIDRNRVVGTLKKVGDNEFAVQSEGKSWHVLTASVTYFKGQDGDEVVILVPKGADSKWGAVENIIRK